MPCNQISRLQELFIEDPHHLEQTEWHRHLATCLDCQQEIRSLDRSLAIYRHLENPLHYPIELQLWEGIQHKINTQAKWYHPAWRVLSTAAMVTLMLGMAWLYQRQQPSSDIPSRYTVVDINPGETADTSGNTQVIWNEKQFGVSIRLNPQWDYSAVSIGMRLVQPNHSLQNKKSPVSEFANRKSCPCPVKKDA